MSKKCQPDKILNPNTGRCVSKTGAIGKRILAGESTSKRKSASRSNCPENKILNPNTGRCVSKTGAIGKRILAESESENTTDKPKKYSKKCQPGKILNPDTGRCVNRLGPMGKRIAAGLPPNPTKLDGKKPLSKRKEYAPRQKKPKKNRFTDNIEQPKNTQPKFVKSNTKFIEQSDDKFQSFINTRFKKFKLDASNKLTPAICKGTKTKFEPFLYQLFIQKYMSPNTPYRGTLLYHGLGSGKTCTSIITSKEYTKATGKRKIVVMTPAALRTNYQNELLNCGKFKSRSDILKFYTFISYNATNVLDKIDELPGGLNNKFLIIDEVHNVISSMMNKKGKGGIGLYKRIMEAKNVKLLFLSGTPIINNPFELSLLFNLLQPGVLTLDVDEFFGKYVDKLNAINMDEFKTKIRGLVSYYIGADPTSDIFPNKRETLQTVQMSSYQFNLYKQARLRELASFKKDKGPDDTETDTFRVFSRQFSNFVFPERLAKERNPDDLTSNDLKDLDKYSPKMKKILENIKKSPKGPVLVYSNFKSIEGIEVFSKILQLHKISYIKWVGGVSDKQRIEILKEFNQPKNKDGSLFKVFMITAAGAEGISLKNVRQVHIMEPHWNNVRITQVIGRAVRICSHYALPKKDQFVEIVKYMSLEPSNISKNKFEEETTDQAIQRIADNKTILNDQFLSAIKTSAVDCTLNLNHNKDVQSCF